MWQLRRKVKDKTGGLWLPAIGVRATTAGFPFHPGNRPMRAHCLKCCVVLVRGGPVSCFVIVLRMRNSCYVFTHACSVSVSAKFSREKSAFCRNVYVVNLSE